MTDKVNLGDPAGGLSAGSAGLAGPGVVRDILEHLPHGVLLLDSAGEVVFRNAAARNILGDEPWETLLSSVGWEAGGETGVSRLDQARDGASLRDFEVHLLDTGTMTPRRILLDATPLRGTDGVTACLFTVREAPEKTADRRLCEKLSRVVEQTADIVVITDARGVMEYVNPAFETITGYSRREALGMTPALLRSGVHDEAFYTRLWDTIEARQPYRGVIVNRRKNGDLFVSEQTITPVINESNEITHFVSVAKDVTEAREAEAREREILLARTVQQRLYPRSLPTLPGYDLSGDAFPMGAVGGDYFDFIPSADGGMCLVIGDVAGHGLDAALYMSTARAYLRLAVEQESDPAAILETVNRMLSGDLDSNRFVTMLVVCLDPVRRRLCYANAGHVPGFLLGSSGTSNHYLSATGLPLGVMPDSTYARVDLELAVGDTVALFTDGVTEAESASGEFFELARALSVIQSHKHESAAAIVGQLHRECMDFVGEGPVCDDFAAVICKLVDSDS